MTFTDNDRQLYTKGVATKDGRTHAPNQQYLLELAGMALPEEIKNVVEETNVLDYFIANQVHINGEMDILLGKNGKVSREAYIKEMIPTIEIKRKQTQSSNDTVTSPTTEEKKTPVKKDSNTKEKKMLMKAMRAQIYSMLGTTEVKNKTLREAVQEHFAKNIKSTAKVIIAAYDTDDELTDETRTGAMEYSIVSTFEKLLGPIPVADAKDAAKPLEEVATLGKLFSLKYQKVLLAKLEVKEGRIEDAFKNKVLTTTAKSLSSLTDDSEEESRESLEPEYEAAMEDLKNEIFPAEAK